MILLGILARTWALVNPSGLSGMQEEMELSAPQIETIATVLTEDVGLVVERKTDDPAVIPTPTATSTGTAKKIEEQRTKLPINKHVYLQEMKQEKVKKPQAKRAKREKPKKATTGDDDEIDAIFG